MNRAASKALHYLLDANPYKSIETIQHFANKELLYHHEEIAAFNKPPGFTLLGEENEDHLEIVRKEIQSKFGWERCYQFYLTPKELSGIMFFSASKRARDDLMKLIRESFTSQNVNFLKYYAITTSIPLKPEESEVFHTKFVTLDNTDVAVKVEQEQIVKKRTKTNEIRTHQVSHKVLDYNMHLNVGLLELNSTLNTNDGIQFYCMKKLAPCLGDGKYSSFLRNIGKFSFLINQENYRNEPQALNEPVKEALGINKYMTTAIPLHLHLHEMNLEKKFKKQKIVFKIQAPPLGYFNETLNRFGLKFENNNK